MNATIAVYALILIIATILKLAALRSNGLNLVVIYRLKLLNYLCLLLAAKSTGINNLTVGSTGCMLNVNLILIYRLNMCCAEILSPYAVAVFYLYGKGFCIWLLQYLCC